MGLRLQVLTKVGSAHFGLSAGLVVGGKDFNEERARVTTMNILVATPGRLVQVGPRREWGSVAVGLRHGGGGGSWVVFFFFGGG